MSVNYEMPTHNTTYIASANVVESNMIIEFHA